MNYKSTRGGGHKTSTFVTLHGLASDGGLYIPEKLPDIVLGYDDFLFFSF